MMSLTIYSDRHRPPEGVNIITQNDVYFNGAVELTGSKLEAVILQSHRQGEILFQPKLLRNFKRHRAG